MFAVYQWANYVSGWEIGPLYNYESNENQIMENRMMLMTSSRSNQEKLNPEKVNLSDYLQNSPNNRTQLADFSQPLEKESKLKVLMFIV